MPVWADDLEAATALYAEALPDQLDLVHLGLGPDGHTASRKVTPTDEVGCKRIMLTDSWYPTLTKPNVEPDRRGRIERASTGTPSTPRTASSIPPT